MQLLYAHDPMCSWCWAFRPVYDQLLNQLPEQIRLTRLLGGLAPDSDVPMPDKTRQYVQGQWQRIQEKVPGTRFNFDFWTECIPRRSTYPACRAVIAARQQGDQYDPLMTDAIQRAYYLNASNPSDSETLITLAGEIGLDRERFAEDLQSPDTMQTLTTEINESQATGLTTFPSLALVQDDVVIHLQLDYLSVDTMLGQIEKYLRETEG